MAQADLLSANPDGYFVWCYRPNYCGPENFQALPRNKFPSRADQRKRPTLSDHTFDEDFDRTATWLACPQPCLEHCTVVQHQHIPGSNQSGQITKMPVLERAPNAHLKQSRGPSLLGWLLGDEFLRKIEIVVGEGLHA